ncbi:MAG: hypothetical protein CMI54_00120 [Parcubacteria group bacterium]|nr:hypothetical protein [Parcubacteria group bacterium]|tara:strand:+ start:10188 stop:11138 length:951 start_codon:yes stop_codon:yes gene_type:complete
MENKVLLVYNTCGIRQDNTDHYIKCINTFLKQKFDGFKIVLSSCKNSPKCIKKIYATFGNKISYCLTPELHTVNITFNKACQESVKAFGDFESYMYVDSGCWFEEDDIIQKTYDCLKSGPHGIVAVQVDNDEALDILDPKFRHTTDKIQIKGEHYTIPIGKSINQHVHLFSKEIFQNCNQKIEPDVFAAHCSESVFNYIAAASSQRWVIMADKQINHHCSIDGASSGYSHHSNKFYNTWNNLLCGRDALEFINDPESHEVGVGYEECNNIMNHDPDAYDEDGFAKYPDRLLEKVNRYFFLNKEELNYDNIKCKFIV